MLAAEISPTVGLRYWDLDPDTLGVLLHGHAVRQARSWYRTAWLASHILSGLVGKKAPKPERLLGPEVMRLIRPTTHRQTED